MNLIPTKRLVIEWCYVATTMFYLLYHFRLDSKKTLRGRMRAVQPQYILLCAVSSGGNTFDVPHGYEISCMIVADLSLRCFGGGSSDVVADLVPSGSVERGFGNYGQIGSGDNETLGDEVSVPPGSVYGIMKA